VANYNVDIQVGIKGTGALDRFTKTVNALAEKTELVNENFSKGIQNIARYEQNLNRTARTLKLARTGQEQETIAIKNFVKALGEANTARERQDRLIKKEIATQNAAKRVTSPGPTGFSRAQFGPALPPAMVKRQERLVGLSKTLKELQAISEDIAINRLNIANKRIESERRFNQESEEGNRIARQKTAEFLKQQRLLLQMSRQYSEPIGPIASGAAEFRRDNSRRRRAQFIESGAPGVPVAGAQQALPAFRERGLQILDNSVRLNESQLRIEAALNGERQRGVRFLEAQSREEKRQLDLGIAGQRSNLIPGVSSGKAVPRTQYSRPIGPQPAGARRGAARGGSGGLSDLALGVGFPLLFGGGAGSIAGGALGSVGGMGGQVLGSAIGGIVDQAVASVAKLGQALNPLTADIGAVTAAAGESGTAFEKLVKDLEKLAGTEKALEVATAQLTTVIGQDGVSALKKFGEESAELGRLYGETLSQISAAVAGLINSSGLLTAFANQLEKVSLVNLARNNATKDPELTDLNQELTRAEFGKGDRSINVITEELVARQKELQIAEQLKIVEEARAEIVKQKAADAAFTNNILRAEIALAESGLDLTTETGLELAKKLIQQKFLAANQKELNEGLSGETSELVKQLALINLKNKANKDTEAKDRKDRREAEAAQRKAEAAARRAAREQEARERKAKQLQQSIFNEDLKQLQIQSKINQFYQGESEAIETQIKELELVLNARVEQVKVTTEDLTLQNEKIETLKMQAQLELASLDRSKEQLLLAEQASALSAAAGFDVLGLAGNTDAVQNRGIYGADTGPVSFEEGIDLAPLIAYQVELDKILEKYPLIGEAANAAAGLITTGFESIIDGTKSAEEVFSDFLRSIADMLMKTAQQMIAQYIAIGIAKMFAGMGSSFSGSSFSDFTGSITGGNPFAPGGILPTFADGGRPPVGRPSIVGERGPELFVPGASGTIIPNEAMGGTNVVVNVDASGSSAQGDGRQAKQLGSAIGAAVQAELIKQKRPGGLLSA